MKKSFYELYNDRQLKKSQSKIIEQEIPKIRSPDYIRNFISYYLKHIFKIIIAIIVIILSLIGVLVITDEYLRNEFIKLLINN